MLSFYLLVLTLEDSFAGSGTGYSKRSTWSASHTTITPDSIRFFMVIIWQCAFKWQESHKNGLLAEILIAFYILHSQASYLLNAGTANLKTQDSLTQCSATLLCKSAFSKILWRVMFLFHHLSVSVLNVPFLTPWVSLKPPLCHVVACCHIV